MNIGLDIGTTLTKAVVFGDRGEVLASRSAPTQLLRPAPGEFEVDLEQLTLAVLSLLRDLASPEIDLIALTGQGDGLWLLDAHARAVRPALTWLDGRGAAACDGWAASGVWDAVFRRTRNAPFPGAGAALLSALDATEPGLLEAATTATQCQHALFERLTGVRTATPSCATLPVLDPVAGDYDDETIRLLKLWHRRDLLPPISPTPLVRAPLADELADDLNLPRGTHVATGPYDLPAAALGIGTLAPGDGVLILGTTLACMVLEESVEPTDEPVGLTIRAADGNGLLRAMPAMVGTACLDWAMRLVGCRFDDLGRLLSESPPSARGVSALPFLAPSGERAPFADPAARAELTGLSLETTAADIVRAVCEALAFAARHCFAGAGLRGEVFVCGGGAASLELVQLFADVMERSLRITAIEEPAAFGAVQAATSTRRQAGRSGRLVKPRAGRYSGHVFDDYLYRVKVAREHRWHGRVDRGSGH
ncbi:MAG TPA: FGGY family carbohydrate kinase [Chloroflexota bacterium]